MRRLAAASGLLLAGLLAGCRDDPASPASPAHLLLITIDTLRADHLGCYGYAPPTSPAIDALARDGVLFESAMAQRGGTWPSLTSILTAKYPHTHGVRRNGDRLAPAHRSLAELLRERGYTTAAFLTNMRTAPNRGFEHVPQLPKGDVDGAAVEALVEWLARRREAPFFAWLHLVGPHDPYVPSRRQQQRFDTGYRGELHAGRAVLQKIHRERIELTEAELAHLVALYDGDIARVDERVSEVLAALDALELAPATLVVLTADHGEELYQHHRYFLHSLSIYESVLHVPLILRLPGVLPRGERVSGPVETVDLAPTVLELLGVPRPPDYQGDSLLPRIRGEPPAGEAAAFSELGPDIHSIRTERWRYIWNRRAGAAPAPGAERLGGSDFPIASEELYDLRSDPLEQANAVDRHPDVAAQLRQRLETWRAGAGPSPEAQPLAPETEQELRALGYLE